MRHSLWFLPLSLVSRCLAGIVNVTVDDSDDAIIYAPSVNWNVGATCEWCTVKLNASEAHNGTWHDGTFNKNRGSNPLPNRVLQASLTFEGNAVYVYCILALSLQSPTGRSDMTFFIDGQERGSFRKEAPGQEGFLYNFLVFSAIGLPHERHTLGIQGGRIDGLKSLVLLDYIVYSYEDISDPVSTPTASLVSPVDTSQAKIIGGVIGGVVAFLLGVIALVVYHRRKQKEQMDPSTEGSQPVPCRRLISRWHPFHRSDEQPRRASFNPNLLVRSIVSKTRSHSSNLRRFGRRGPPAPLPIPYEIDPLSTRELNLTGTSPLIHTSGLLTSNSNTPPPLQPSRLESIQAWQRRTETETRNMQVEPPDMSEELSSYYDENATESNRVRTPPPTPPAPPPRMPTPARRFTVMNN